MNAPMNGGNTRERREPLEERVLDAALRVAVRPVAERKPEHDAHRDGQVDDQMRRTRAQEAGENVHSGILEV